MKTMNITKRLKSLVTGATLALLTVLLVGAVSATGANSKVVICHIPQNNPDNEHELMVPTSALNGHMGHGDHLGECNPEPPEEIITGIAF